MALIKNLLMSFLLCYSTVYADNASQWNIVPSESHLSFTGTQNNAPVTGSFKSFAGTIHVDPEHYQSSTVHVVIHIGSITLSYAELATILLTPDWFNVEIFPKAEFKSTKINKVNEKIYEAEGTLTIKGKTVPVTLTFTGEESPKNHLHVEGKTTIKRSIFGVGEGEWSDSDVVKDEVTINFRVIAVPK